MVCCEKMGKVMQRVFNSRAADEVLIFLLLLSVRINLLSGSSTTCNLAQHDGLVILMQLVSILLVEGAKLGCQALVSSSHCELGTHWRREDRDRYRTGSSDRFSCPTWEEFLSSVRVLSFVWKKDKKNKFFGRHFLGFSLNVMNRHCYMLQFFIHA